MRHVCGIARCLAYAERHVCDTYMCKREENTVMGLLKIWLETAPGQLNSQYDLPTSSPRPLKLSRGSPSIIIPASCVGALVVSHMRTVVVTVTFDQVFSDQ